jgi:hypothetical protein
MKILYLIRFVVCYLTMECVLHFMYVVAIKDTKSWIGDSPAEIAMIGFWNLIVVWLKVNIFTSPLLYSIDCVTSCSFLGDFSGRGLYLMASILRKIWSDVWQITTQRSGSGEAGIEVITFGLSGVLLCFFLVGNYFM